MIYYIIAIVVSFILNMGLTIGSNRTYFRSLYEGGRPYNVTDILISAATALLPVAGTIGAFIGIAMVHRPAFSLNISKIPESAFSTWLKNTNL